MTILSNEEILKIYRGMASGPGSAMATHDSVDKIMEELIGEKDFTDNKYQLSNKQVQVMLGTMEALIKRVESNEGKNDTTKTDSRSMHVQTTDGNENNRLSGERERPEDSTGLDGLRSVQEVRDSSDVSNIQPDGETDSGR